jgi:TrmH family RNA methyltransferase
VLSKNKIKHLRSLHQKKYRINTKLFFIEGEKMLEEAFLQTKYKVKDIFLTEEFVAKNTSIIQNVTYTVVSNKELNQISTLKTPNSGLATLELNSSILTAQENKLYLYLDNIQDPGNLGTIIRTADWFGVDGIFCSPNTADVFNPKVLQSTMGAIFRMNITYQALDTILTSLPKDFPVYGAFLNSNSIYNQDLTKNGIIVMGNESKGISESSEKLVRFKISIPNFGISKQKTESLNVAQACGIILSEFKRNT